MAGGRSKDAREATAYHEASHAVAALQLGFKVHSVSLAPREDSGGHAVIMAGLRNPNWIESPTVKNRMARKAEAYSVQAIAGIVGQGKYRPRSVRNFHASSDYHQAIEMLAGFGWRNEEIELFLPLARYRAKAILEQYWYQVEALAAALIEKETLPRAEVLKVIAAATQAALRRHLRSVSKR